MKLLFVTMLLLPSLVCSSQDSIISRTPFDGMNLGWINGQNRQRHYPLTMTDKKTGETIVTGVAYLDTYFNYDLNDPVDNTHASSSSIGRHKEFTLNLASLGLETNYKNAIGRIWLQYGQFASIVQELDGSVGRGKNTNISNLKNIREATAGYHFNKWYGINLETGIFMSYIGLESYLAQENWNYQRSMVSDFTPFYFSGVRVQAFPSKLFKTELWLINGWQSYNSWNKSIGIGNSNCWRPNENLQLVGNFYLGRDSRANILRFHHDNSIVARYYKRSPTKGLSQAAFSINHHYGFQEGAGVNPSSHNMTGVAVANRLWFNQNKLGFTLRGDYLTNPGLYLALNPSTVIPNDYTDAIAAVPKQKLKICQATATFDIMPNDYFTLRLEYGYRKSNVPYFAGKGGTTSPDGWIDTPAVFWRPDLKKDESRVTLAMNFRL